MKRKPLLNTDIAEDHKRVSEKNQIQNSKIKALLSEIIEIKKQ
jgi:hypothetical protein